MITAERAQKFANIATSAIRLGTSLIGRSQVRLPMRIVFVVFGVLVLLAGTVFALQGAGYIPGSFMSNNPPWIWIGSITAMVGLAILAFGIRFSRAVKHA